MTITLSKQSGIWHARFTGAGSESITSLFGTDTLPTPYNSLSSGIQVLNATVALNPDSTVVLDGSSL